MTRAVPIDAPEQKLSLTTAIPGPRSLALAARRAQAVPRGAASTMAIYADHADGGIVVDVDGNQFIDFASGIAVTNIGHNVPEVTDALHTQMGQFLHTCFAVTPYEVYLDVAERLNAQTPGDHPKKTVLFNSGAEAVENAVKIARAHTGRQAIAVFDNAFHGRTNLTMAMTAKVAPYKDRFGPFSPEIYRISGSYPLRDGGLSGPEAARRAVGQMEKQIGAGNLAAIVIEPIQGEGGFIVPAPGFLPALATWAAANGVVFIADEVQTGFGRTGNWFACEHEKVVPDLVVMAKGLAGGLPLSAVTGRAAMMDAPRPGGLGGTYVGNPLACAAALAAMKIQESQDLSRAAQVIDKHIRQRFTTVMATDKRVAEVRGRGAMMAIELVDPTTGAPDAALTAAVAAAARANGVITLTCGTYDNVVRFLPPLTISLDLLDQGLDIMVEALQGIEVSA